jgi:hypothetical protein
MTALARQMGGCDEEQMTHGSDGERMTPRVPAAAGHMTLDA